MNGAPSTARFRLWVVLALMAALTLGSFWVLEVMRRSASDYIPNTVRTEPDFYIDKFSYVKISESDRARYHISGAKLTHNPTDDSYDIQLPVVSKLGIVDQSSMTVRSERAHVNSDSSQVQMIDNVHLDRPATATSEHLHVRSDYMLVLPDDDVVQTDKPVEITLGQSRLSGVGMFANNATRELRLSSDVHGTYQAPAR